MNQAIAQIIIGHISGLDFIDKIGGVVSVIYEDVFDGTNKVQKSFPAACCVEPEDCKIGAYNDLSPDSKYNTVIFFEDKGVTFDKHEGSFKYYTSSLRLVCWINVAKILEDDCRLGSECTRAAHLITEIVRLLPPFPEDHTPFVMLHSEVISQEPRSNAIFGAYTFNEKQTQYLLYPFDYFALNIQTTFAICIKSDIVSVPCEIDNLENNDEMTNPVLTVNLVADIPYDLPTTIASSHEIYNVLPDYPETGVGKDANVSVTWAVVAGHWHIYLTSTEDITGVKVKIVYK